MIRVQGIGEDGHCTSAKVAKAEIQHHQRECDEGGGSQLDLALGARDEVNLPGPVRVPDGRANGPGRTPQDIDIADVEGAGQDEEQQEKRRQTQLEDEDDRGRNEMGQADEPGELPGEPGPDQEWLRLAVRTHRRISSASLAFESYHDTWGLRNGGTVECGNRRRVEQVIGCLDHRPAIQLAKLNRA